MRVLLLAALVLGLAASQAGATVLYAKPDGLESGPCTAVASACRLDRAVSAEVTTPGDEVVVLGGTYDATNYSPFSTERLDIHGVVSGPRPVLSVTGVEPALGVGASAAGTTVRHLRFRNVSREAAPLTTQAPSTISDVAIEGLSDCLAVGADHVVVTDVTAATQGVSARCLVLDGDDQTVRNVVVDASTAGSGRAVQIGSGVVEDSSIKVGGRGRALEVMAHATVRRVRAAGGSYGMYFHGPGLVTDSIATGAGDQKAAAVYALSGLLLLRNVDAFAFGPEAAGVLARGDHGHGRALVDARNVIVRGGLADLVTEAAAPSECGSSPCEDGRIDAAFSNVRSQLGEGEFVPGPGNQSADPAFADIYRGDYRLADGSPAIDAGTADLLGPTAFDGSARVQGDTVDIGAYERTRPAAPPPPPSDEAPLPPLPGAAVSPLVLAPAADTTAPRLSGAKVLRVGRSWRLRVTASEACSLRVRLVRVGRSARAVRTFTRLMRRGANVVTLLPGRLAGGRYRLVLVARDAADNASPPRRLSIRLPRKARR
jgi:hypothetical protein